MLACFLALALGTVPTVPTVPGTYRRPIAATDGVHVATYLYVPKQRRRHSATVVLLPDVGATHLFFDLEGQGLAPWLVARGFRVLTLDWRGTGVSESPPGSASLEDLERLDLPAALSALGAADEPVVLLGWGYSGALAYAAAADPALASRIVGVVALDGVVNLDVPNPQVARLLDTDGGALDLPSGLGQRAPRGNDDLFALLWLHGGTFDRATHLTLLVHGLGALSATQVSELREGMATRSLALGGDYPAAVKRVRCPVLAIQGQLDNWTHPEFATPVRDLLPESQVQTYTANRLGGFAEDLGHVGLVLGGTAEHDVLPRVITFLEKVGDRPPRATP